MEEKEGRQEVTSEKKNLLILLYRRKFLILIMCLKSQLKAGKHQSTF
jgi:hypothetical protein